MIMVQTTKWLTLIFALRAMTSGCLTTNSGFDCDGKWAKQLIDRFEHCNHLCPLCSTSTRPLTYKGYRRNAMPHQPSLQMTQHQYRCMQMETFLHPVPACRSSTPHNYPIVFLLLAWLEVRYNPCRPGRTTTLTRIQLLDIHWQIHKITTGIAHPGYFHQHCCPIFSQYLGFKL